MGLLGRWRIFTQKEDGSDSIGLEGVRELEGKSSMLR
jgi:hypothetical protein